MPFVVRILILLTPILFISCANPNHNEIERIEKIEKNILRDQKILESINTEYVENLLKLARFNLSKLEEKSLDSISVELIYFEYRDYLNCINDMNEFIPKNRELQQAMNLNIKQLQNIKMDYIQTKQLRLDLNKHLKNEIYIINTTSKAIQELAQSIGNKTVEFDSLNKIMEQVIYE